MSVTDILVDFAIASFFIAVGQLLRAKVPLVQKFFIPAKYDCRLSRWHSGRRDWESCRFLKILVLMQVF